MFIPLLIKFKIAGISKNSLMLKNQILRKIPNKKGEVWYFKGKEICFRVLMGNTTGNPIINR